MKRVAKVSAIIVVAFVVVGAGILIFSGGLESPEEKLSRELNAEEQEIVDQNVFTPETLAEFDGQDGQSAYVAVNGIVYDVTGHWEGGKHHGLEAGRDETEGFLNSPHDHTKLQGLEVKGSYKDDE